MTAQGCRFLSRCDDDTHYEIIPPTFDAIRRKVLRALRQEVLKQLEFMSPENRRAREVELEASRNDLRGAADIVTAPKSVAKTIPILPKPSSVALPPADDFDPSIIEIVNRIQNGTYFSGG